MFRDNLVTFHPDRAGKSFPPRRFPAMKNKLDVMALATGLTAVAVLAAAWLVSAVRAHARTAETPGHVVAMHISSGPPPAATSTAGKPPEIKIIHAVYGYRDHTANVTQRVSDLMHSRGWFHADVQDMGVDPLPRRTKWMTISYTAQGKYAVLKVRGKSTVGPVRLMNNAGMDASGAPLSPAAAASASVVVDDGEAPSVEVQTVAGSPR